jgi:hypothetical protein
MEKIRDAKLDDGEVIKVRMPIWQIKDLSDGTQIRVAPNTDRELISRKGVREILKIDNERIKKLIEDQSLSPYFTNNTSIWFYRDEIEHFMNSSKQSGIIKVNSQQKIIGYSIIVPTKDKTNKYYRHRGIILENIFDLYYTVQWYSTVINKPTYISIVHISEMLDWCMYESGAVCLQAYNLFIHTAQNNEGANQ